MLVDVVERVGTLRMTRDLRDLPGRQVRVEILRELLALLRQPLDLFRNIDGESSCTKRSSSIFASSSAIGCSKSRNVVFTYVRVLETIGQRVF